MIAIEGLTSTSHALFFLQEVNMEKLLSKILEKIKKDAYLFQTWEDLLYMSKEAMKEDIPLGVKYLKLLSAECERAISDPLSSEEEVKELYGLHKRVLLAAAPYDFDSYLLYVEWSREPKKKFYPPRRKVLKQVVDALQELADDKLDLLAVSLPPGSGKTTLAIFYLTWLGGRIPNEPMLTGSHSNSFVRGVYDECLRIFDANGDYLWHDVFPDIQVSNTNAKDCRIDLDKRQRFETLEFTSIGTGNAGLYRAATLLYCDDLVSGIEVALSKERLDKLWETYTTDLRQRKIGDHCKELHIATRWSVHDVIGRLEREYMDSDRAKFIIVPAMDENDESNFDYAYGVGFSTKFYREQRGIMDDVSWRALYMNEPIEREGLVYSPDELRRYFDLPKEDADAIIGICDTKDKGADYAFLPVAYVYGQDYYIDDCVCDNGLPNIVDARLVEILVRDKVKSCRFESNSAGRRVAEKIQEEVKKKNGITHITTKFTTANKETKIIVNSAWVKEHCLFKDASLYQRKSDYGKMMDMLCSYTVAGKNKHDDVPDGMAMLAEYAQSLSGQKVEVFKRPW
ncbi:phage terminase large subunit [Ligaoa zhengdingensis]|jgi:predicted phage terminase large subunit-like protein|uniref:phage terminase large subunit n=1 Tax=Ligaoa zhengdingensis TaxID=2763658 RepID=UPI0031BA0B58